MKPLDQSSPEYEAISKFIKHCLLFTGGSLLMIIASCVLFMGEPDLIDALVFNLMN